jgi:uncharacterized protein (DUF2336 family)
MSPNFDIVYHHISGVKIPFLLRSYRELKNFGAKCCRTLRSRTNALAHFMAAITSADVIAELETTVRASPSERCSLMLRRVTELLLGTAPRLSKHQLEIFDEILLLLADRVEVHALAELSDALAGLDAADLEIKRSLARHGDAAVAAPILQKSGQLPDEHLIAIALSGGPGHILAIAKRSAISAALADVLLKTEDTKVCVQLAGNAGIRFSPQGYSKLVAMAERNDDLANLLVQRTDVPTGALRELLSRMPRSVRARLLRIARPELRETIQSAIENVEIGICTKAPPRVDYSEAKAKVLELNNLGKLSDSTVNRFAVWHEYPNLVAALAQLATAPIETIEPLVREGDCHGLIVACRASRLNWNTTHAVISNRPDQPKLSGEEVEQFREMFEGLNLSAAQRMIRFGSSRDFAQQLQPAEDARAASQAV